MVLSRNEQITLFMWKSFRLKIHRPVRFFFEIFTPVFVVFFVILLRTCFDKYSKDAVTFDAFTLDNVRISDYQLAYAPNQSKLAQTLVSSIEQVLSKEITGYESEEMALEQLQVEINPWAVIIFPSSYKDLDTLPASVMYTLRFPSELRKSDGLWNTNLMGPNLWYLNPYTWNSKFPGYNEEGFLSLQNVVSNSIIENHPKRKDTKTPEISLRGFPQPHTQSEVLYPYLGLVISILITLGFTMPVYSLIMDISDEKRRGVKELFKLLSVTNCIQWTAWFVLSFLILSVVMIVIVIILKGRFWHEYGCFPEANSVILLVVMITYLAPLITFCFIMGSLFCSPLKAAIIGAIVFVVSLLPTLILQVIPNAPRWVSLIACLSFNSAMSQGIHIFLSFEILRVGVQIDNMWQSTAYGESIPLYVVLLILILDALIHLAFAWYLEKVFPGPFGKPMKWYFIFQWRRKRKQEYEIEEIFSDPSTSADVSLEFKSVYKSFPNSPQAIQNISMNLYLDEITVMIGRKGSGKTTLFSLLINKEEITSGHIFFRGEPLNPKHLIATKGIGFCPRNTILYSHLTLADHIEILARIKGLAFPGYYYDIKRFSEMIGVYEDTLVKDMTPGQQRSLAVALAYCGGSSLVLIDEPSVGLPRVSRFAISQLMHVCRKGRTTLVFTRLVDETEQADRIAVIAHGELRCYGSQASLYGINPQGYHIKFIKLDTFDIDGVNAIFTENIPLSDFNFIGETNALATFNVSINAIEFLPDLFLALEEQQEDLGFKGVQVFDMRLEDVFNRLSSDYQDKPPIKQYTSNFQKVKGLQLYCNQLLAMSLKCGWHVKYSGLRWLVLILGPLIGFMSIYEISYAINLHRNQQPAREITINDYPESFIILHSPANSDVEKRIMQNLKSVATIIPYYADVLNELSRRMTEEYRDMLSNYQVAIEVNEDKMVLWYNSLLYHTAPLALNIAHNLFLKDFDKASEIHVVNHPLPTPMFRELEQEYHFGCLFAVSVGVGILIVTFVISYFYVKERRSGVKQLQCLSGVPVHLYWVTGFVIDLLIYSCFLGVLLIWLTFQPTSIFKELSTYLDFIIIMYAYAYSLLPTIYLLSIRFDELTCTIFIALGYVFYFIIHFFFTNDLIIYDYLNQIHIATCFNSFYATLVALGKFFMETSRILGCMEVYNRCLAKLKNEDACEVRVIELVDRCRIIENKLASFDYFGIYYEMIALMIMGTIFWIILFIYQSYIGRRLVYCLTKNKYYKVKEPSDDDVRSEIELVRTMTEDKRKEYAVIIKHLILKYRKNTVVRGVSIAVKPSEVFVFLGFNGSGRTTIMKVMTGQLRMTSGDTYINDMDIKESPRKFRKQIGYIPGENTLYEAFTVRDTLIIFGLLKGYRWSDRDEFVKHFANRFQLDDLVNTKITRITTSDKRKLCAAVAIMGDPSVIFMDDPTKGMTAAAKLSTWENIVELQSKGKCVIVTTSSITEASAISTRMGILISGQLVCLGVPQYLVEKFSQSFMIIIKTYVEEDPHEGMELRIRINDVVQSVFPQAYLDHFNSNVLTYNVLEASDPWSEVFRRLMIIADSKMATEVSISQMSLQHIYLRLVSAEGLPGSK